MELCQLSEMQRNKKSRPETGAAFLYRYINHQLQIRQLQPSNPELKKKCRLAHYPAITGLCSTPMCSSSTVTSPPTLMGGVVPEVPVQIMSPGYKVT